MIATLSAYPSVNLFCQGRVLPVTGPSVQCFFTVALRSLSSGGGGIISLTPTVKAPLDTPHLTPLQLVAGGVRASPALESRRLGFCFYAI